MVKEESDLGCSTGTTQNEKRKTPILYVILKINSQVVVDC